MTLQQLYRTFEKLENAGLARSEYGANEGPPEDDYACTFVVIHPTVKIEGIGDIARVEVDLIPVGGETDSGFWCAGPMDPERHFAPQGFEPDDLAEMTVADGQWQCITIDEMPDDKEDE